MLPSSVDGLGLSRYVSFTILLTAREQEGVESSKGVDLRKWDEEIAAGKADSVLNLSFLVTLARGTKVA